MASYDELIWVTGRWVDMGDWPLAWRSTAGQQRAPSAHYLSWRAPRTRDTARPVSRIPYSVIPESRLYPFIPYPISHYPVSRIPLSRLYPVIPYPLSPYPVSRIPYPGILYRVSPYPVPRIPYSAYRVSRIPQPFDGIFCWVFQRSMPRNISVIPLKHLINCSHLQRCCSPTGPCSADPNHTS
jgi:hypothetical protein